MATSSVNTDPDFFSTAGSAVTAEYCRDSLSATDSQTPNGASYLSRGFSHFLHQGHVEGSNSNYAIHERNDERQSTLGVALRPRFACPFHKLNPSKYQSCEHYLLTNWYNTHQHLYRVHSLGTDIKRFTYCPNCRVLFKGKTAEKEWKFHIQDGKCKTASIGETGMLLPQEYTNLTGLGAGFSNEQRWLSAWNKLFPHLCEPSSPYFENHVDLLRRHAYDRIRQILGNDDTQVIHSTVCRLFTPPVIPHRASNSHPDPDSDIPDDWSASQSLLSPLLSHPTPLYAPEIENSPAMTQSFEVPMQQMFPSTLPQAMATPDLDNLHYGYNGVFPDPFALQHGEDLPFYTDQAYGS
ncbi:hypothetical protein ACHAP8_007128 [Fusarium lateritium]